MTGVPETAAGGGTLAALVGDVTGLATPFTRAAVLAAPLLEPALAALEARARSEAGRRVLAQARTGTYVQPEGALTGAEPVVAAFFRGLGDLAGANLGATDPPARAVVRADLERAAQGFRDAMRADADFLPAAVFLGACYALGGRDQEAAGAWQTALIAIDDSGALFALIADARLRAGDPEGADEILAEAERKWPADVGLKERRVVVDLSRGRVVEAFAALDELRAPKAELWFAAMRILHSAHVAGLAVEDPIRDRQRFERYLTGYIARGGPDRALAERWFSAVK